MHTTQGTPSVASPTVTPTVTVASTAKKPKIWLDGCFDLFHWGHANVLRQARKFIDANNNVELSLGIHSDAEILRVKGPCLMNEFERYGAARACRFVDNLVEDVPYSPNLPLMRQHKIDYVIHGDDVAVDANGHNAYEEIIDAGLFKVVPRTEGVSTTDLIQRMLDPSNRTHFTGLKHSMLSAGRIADFYDGRRKATKDDVVVYVDGTFDLFHIGHMELLRKAKELGTFLIVGVHNDEDVNKVKGRNFPIMNLPERVLGLLACKYVDEVVIGAPWEVTKEMIESMKASFVVRGKQVHAEISGIADCYAVPKEKGIFREIDSGLGLSTGDIIKRVEDRQKEYEERNKKKYAAGCQ